MIGGVDIAIPNRVGPESLEVAVRAIRQLWPRSVYENGVTGEKYEHFGQIPFSEVEELFVYRDANSAATWDEYGATSETENSMIHVIYDDGLITAVVDERTPEIERFLQSIKSALEDTILTIPAMLEAA